MPLFQLPDKEILFPSVHLAEPDGLLGIGGDLTTDRLIEAYRLGIFPWFNEEPILWWSPDPRFILRTNDIHISRSMKRVLKKGQFEFRINTSFSQVIEHCKSVPRKGQNGTWITADMEEAYKKLHDLGLAYSFETWHNNELQGGMYGVMSDKYFAGESMFSAVPNASKFALIKACEYLMTNGIHILDCQIHSEHLERMGAVEISREEFIGLIS